MDPRTEAPTGAEPSPGAPARAGAASPGSSSARAAAPDLARGIMLLFIAVANVSLYLWGRDLVEPTMHQAPESWLDRVLVTCAIVFVDGRIYPMFAFLFGYGMVQFSRSRVERGVPEATVDRMLRRRHFLLILFGAVHALLLFAADVLGAYGLAGYFIALLLFRRSDRVLAVATWIVAGIVTALSVFVIISPLFTGLDSGPAGPVGSAGSGAGSLSDDDGQGAGPFGIDIGTGAAADSEIDHYGTSIIVRFFAWATSTFLTVVGLNVVLCMLLGWIAARRRWLERPADHATSLHIVAVSGISVGALGGIPQALAYLGVIDAGAPGGLDVGILAAYTGIAGGIGYTAAFGLLALRLRGRIPSVLGPVAGVGRRSLSFYLLQSVIFAPLLTAWGLGLGGRIGSSGAFAIALGVWVLSLVLAGLMESRGARGPAEALLRRLTYGAGRSGRE